MKRPVIPDILAIIFPRHCPVCDGILPFGEGLIHPACRARLRPAKVRTAGERSVFLHDSLMRDSINRFKFRNKKEYARFYADAMARAYSDWILKEGIEVLVPVPVHRKRLLSRGFNQAELLAVFLCRGLRKRGMSLRVSGRGLIRIRDTRPQYRIEKERRALNVERAFFAKRKAFCGKKVLLIDDIRTTGSTLAACRKALFDAGAQKVLCLTVSAKGLAGVGTSLK